MARRGSSTGVFLLITTFSPVSHDFWWVGQTCLSIYWYRECIFSKIWGCVGAEAGRDEGQHQPSPRNKYSRPAQLLQKLINTEAPLGRLLAVEIQETSSEGNHTCPLLWGILRITSWRGPQTLGMTKDCSSSQELMNLSDYVDLK